MRRGAACFALLTSCASSARAQAPAEPPEKAASIEADVRWVGPPPCPSEAEVRAQIGRLLGRESPSGPKRASVEGSASERMGRWRLLLRTETEGEVGRRSIDAPSCAELADTFTLVAALAIDAQATNEHAAAADGAPAPRANPPPPLEAWAGVGLRGSVGLLPHVGIGGGAQIALRSGRSRFELGGGYFPEQDASVSAGPPEVGERVRLLSGWASFCHDLIQGPLPLEGCGGVDVGQLRGVSFGLPEARSERALWLSLHAGPALRLPLASRFVLRGLVEGVMPIARHAFIVEGARAYKPSPFGGQATIAAELRLF